MSRSVQLNVGYFPTGSDRQDIVIAARESTAQQAEPLVKSRISDPRKKDLPMKEFNVSASALTVMCAVGVFMLSSQAQAQAQLIPDGLYYIFSKNNLNINLADPGNSKVHGQDMEVISGTISINDGSALWSVVNLGNNVIELTNSSGMALDVSGASKNAQALVDQWPYSGQKNAQWKVIQLPGSQTYELVSVNSGLALDIVGGSSSSGAKVDQYPYGGKLWQQWVISGAGS
jgi:hypothetical protein